MSGRPFLLVDNVFNPRIYPGHTISASSTAAGSNVLNLSGGRRRAELNVGGWFAANFNVEESNRAVFDRLRGVNAVFVDGGHNLDTADSPQIGVRVTTDDFTTFTELGPYPIPAEPAPFSRLQAGTVVRMLDGSLLIWLGLRPVYGIEVFYPAMGADKRPALSGLMAGFAFEFEDPLVKPNALPQWTHLRDSSRSPRGHAVGSEVGRFHEGMLHVRAASWAEWAAASYHEDLYLRGHGAVVGHDSSRAERASFSLVPAGRTGWEIPTDRYLPEWRIPYGEPEPELI